MVRRWSIILGILGAFALAIGTSAFTQPALASSLTPAATGGHATHGGPFEPAPGPHPATAHGGRAISYSGNWSGYAVTGGTFTTATASWTQNAITCSSSDGQTDMSPWVGLDGDNDNTVEQTGTSGDCNGSTPDYYAWYEMYPANYVTINHTVTPGDKFTGTVTNTSGNSYTLKLSDNTQGWTYTTNQTISGAQNASAEAVMEMAANELSQFGTDPFTSFTVDGQPIGSYTGSQYSIQQIEIQSGSTLCDSTSGLSGEENFSVTWLNLC